MRKLVIQKIGSSSMVWAALALAGLFLWCPLVVTFSTAVLPPVAGESLYRNTGTSKTEPLLRNRCGITFRSGIVGPDMVASSCGVWHELWGGS